MSKAELLDACWPNEFVSESALTRCIRLIRQVVGDDGNRQQVIETVRGYGYRFVAKVTERSAVPNATDAAIDLPLPAENNLPDTPFLSVPERRQLTVLSCGLVEAGALLTRLEADDLHLLMQL